MNELLTLATVLILSVSILVIQIRHIKKESRKKPHDHKQIYVNNINKTYQ